MPNSQRSRSARAAKSSLLERRGFFVADFQCRLGRSAVRNNTFALDPVDKATLKLDADLTFELLNSTNSIVTFSGSLFLHVPLTPATMTSLSFGHPLQETRSQWLRRKNSRRRRARCEAPTAGNSGRTSRPGPNVPIEFRWAGLDIRDHKRRRTITRINYMNSHVD